MLDKKVGRIFLPFFKHAGRFFSNSIFFSPGHLIFLIVFIEDMRSIEFDNADK